MKNAASSEESENTPAYTSITEPERVEEALRESEEKYRNLVESSKDSIIIIDLKGNVQFGNRATEELTGYTVEEGIGMNVRKITPKRYWLKSLAMLLKARRGKPIPYFESVIRRKDGSLVPVESGGQAIFKDGKVVGVQIITRDISERKRAEQALRESEEEFRNIFESASDAMIYLDRSGRIIKVNGKAVEVFGGSKKELLGRHFTKVGVVSPRDIPRLVSAFAKGLAGKKVTLDVCIKNKKGQEIPLECSGSLMKIDGNTIGTMVVARNVTERKQMEEQLRKSEEKYRTVMEEAAIGLCNVDIKGKVTYVNKRVEEVSGYSREEIVGKNGFKLGVFPDASVRLFAKQIKDALMGKPTHPVETRFKCKDGRWIWVHIDARLVKKHGVPVGFQLALRDITERKKAEQALRESQEKFERLFMNNPEAAVYADQDSHILNVNPRFTKLFGYSLSEVKGKLLEDLIVPKGMTVDAEVFTAKVKEGHVYHDTVRRRKVGSLVPVSISAASITAGDKLIGAVILYKDITKRKQMEEKLRQYSEHLETLVQKRTEELLESEKRYSVLVEEASDGVVIIQDERIVFTNKKAPEIIGYSKNELIGLPFEKIIDQKYHQHTKERCMQKIQGEEVPQTTYEIELIARTGERIPVEVSSTVIRYQGRPSNLGIIRDIRDRKRMEEQRLKLEKLATMGELATMVAHDLRNPLTSIRNAGYYIKNVCPHCADAECKTVGEMLDIIEQETVYANNIVNDLLDLSAKRPLQKKRQNINKLIETALTRSNIPENIKVKRKLAEKTIATIDEKQLKRVFLNLTKNAVQAMPNGGKLTIKTSETKDHVELAFTDTGVGIPEENMGKIFTPLFTTKAKGMGIGLAICKRIVEQHEGTIDVKSKVGKGTTFTIKLPKKEEGNSQ